MLKKISYLLLSLMIMVSTTACSTKEKPHLDQDTKISVTTNMGTFELLIFADMKELAYNFVELARQGKYDNSPFHRVIKNFMNQGGDFTLGNGRGGHSYKGPGTKLDDFFLNKYSNVRGTLSMANAGADTNGSQFFINVVDNTGLDFDKHPLKSKHAVIGKVTDGMEIVDEINGVETGLQDRPLQEVKILKMAIIEEQS